MYRKELLRMEMSCRVAYLLAMLLLAVGVLGAQQRPAVPAKPAPDEVVQTLDKVDSQEVELLYQGMRFVQSQGETAQAQLTTAENMRAAATARLKELQKEEGPKAQSAYVAKMAELCRRYSIDPCDSAAVTFESRELRGKKAKPQEAVVTPKKEEPAKP